MAVGFLLSIVHAVRIKVQTFTGGTREHYTRATPFRIS